MKSIKFLTGLALLCLAGTAAAQNEVDALRYSRLDIGGTARTMAIGGAQAALGADAGNLAGNPAGLGMFRRSEFTFSPGVHIGNTSSSLAGQKFVDDRNNVNLSGFGMIFANRKSDGTEGSWRGGSFGIGFTRQNNFQNKFNYSRSTNGLTLVEYFADNANEFGLEETNFESQEGLAYETRLLDVINDRYVETERKGVVQQSEDVLSKGAQNQWDFSYGASYLDKLYIGGSVGFSSLRYTQERVFKESEADATTTFQNLTLRDNFTTTGNGINAKLGFIFKPIDLLRIGASIQTPTYFKMNDSYGSSLDTRLDQAYTAEMDPGEYSYSLKTPFRATGGVAVILGKYGFITSDVEVVDYSTARLTDEFDNSVFKTKNNKINNIYGQALNFKMGAEGRFDIFRVRAGYALMGDPYSKSDYDRKKSFITGGIGIKQANYFVDLAVAHSNYTSVYSPYSISDNSEPVVNTNNKATNTVLTLGMNF